MIKTFYYLVNLKTFVYIINKSNLKNNLTIKTY